MLNVPVQTIAQEQGLAPSWRSALQQLSEKVRLRAFELFENGGRSNGHDLDNWFEAEKQLLSVSPAELSSNATEFQVQLAVPGFDETEVEVTALPSSLLVKAETNRTSEKNQGNVCSSEMSDLSLFRRIPLPQSIDAANVTAKLDKGILKIVAPKTVKKPAKVKTQAMA